MVDLRGIIPAKVSDLEKVRINISMYHPFFAPVMFSTPYEVREKLPHRACTDMQKIYFRRSFLESLTFDAVKFVLAHELMHIILKHGLRRGGRNLEVWNDACDYAVNWMLKECGFTLIPDILYNVRFANMSVEQIYVILMQEKQQQPQPEPEQGDGQGQGQSGTGDDEQDDEENQDGPDTEDEQDDDGSRSDEWADNHEQAQQDEDDSGPIGSGDLIEAPLTEIERMQVERTIDSHVLQGAQLARMQGNLPAVLDRLVAEIVDPQVPWQQVLRDMATRIVHDEESWSRRNRRFARTYLPAKRNEMMGEIGFIGDTSGSIQSKELAGAAAEAIDIAQSMNPERMRVLWADTRVAREQVFEMDDVPQMAPIGTKGANALAPKGGGGTDMRVPLEYMEQFEPQVVILYTDGYTPWPKVEPSYPLIVCCTTNAPVPIGQVIRVNP